MFEIRGREGIYYVHHRQPVPSFWRTWLATARCGKSKSQELVASDFDKQTWSWLFMLFHFSSTLCFRLLCKMIWPRAQEKIAKDIFQKLQGAFSPWPTCLKAISMRLGLWKNSRCRLIWWGPSVGYLSLHSTHPFMNACMCSQTQTRAQTQVCSFTHTHDHIRRHAYSCTFELGCWSLHWTFYKIKSAKFSHNQFPLGFKVFGKGYYCGIHFFWQIFQQHGL